MQSEIIVFKQLPVIEGKLQEISAKIQEEINVALSLECTEESNAYY